MYPTKVRSLSLGFGALSGKLGVIIAPYVSQVGRFSFNEDVNWENMYVNVGYVSFLKIPCIAIISAASQYISACHYEYLHHIRYHSNGGLTTSTNQNNRTYTPRRNRCNRFQVKLQTLNTQLKTVTTGYNTADVQEDIITCIWNGASVYPVLERNYSPSGTTYTHDIWPLTVQKYCFICSKYP